MREATKAGSEGAAQISLLLIRFFLAAALCVAQPTQNVVEFTVRKHPNVDLTTEDVQTILNRAAKILNDECDRLERPNSRRNKTPQLRLKFQLKGDLSLIAPIENALLVASSNYPPRAMLAIRESEKTGLYGRDAVESLMAATDIVPELQINVVEQIVAPCPSEVRPLSPGRQTTSAGVYPWLGCSEISGKVTVLRLFAPKEKTSAHFQRWANREALLWAHEIAHLLGLDDLEPRLRPALPPVKVGWLMMHPFNPSAGELLMPECKAVMNYPRNDAELRFLRDYLQRLSKKVEGN